MPKIPVWGWIALAVGAIFLLRPRVAVGAGQAIPQGSLGQVDMGAVLSKPKGAPVNVKFSFTASTKNAAGVLIPWSYKDRVGLYAIVGGTNIDVFNSGVFTSAPGTFPVNIGLFTLNGVVGQEYEAVVELWVAASNPDGTPNTANMILVDTQDSRPDVVLLTAAAPTAAVPAGSIVPPVTLTQAMRAAQEFLRG